MSAVKDPTAEEMRDFLKSQFGEEMDEFDQEGAIYWFCYGWHGGQSSNMYSALSTSEFHPGPATYGPEGSMMKMCYEALEAEYAK